MKSGEKKLLELLGKDAIDLMSGCICNDLTNDMLDCLTEQEWDELHLEMHEDNGDPEEFRPGLKPPGWWVFSFLMKKVLGEIK